MSGMAFAMEYYRILHVWHSMANVRFAQPIADVFSSVWLTLHAF